MTYSSNSINNKISSEEHKEIVIIEEMFEFCQATSGIKQWGITDTTEWINRNKNDHGYEIYNEHEILSIVTEENDSEYYSE